MMLRVLACCLALCARSVTAYTSAELAAMPRGGSPCDLHDPFHCMGNGECSAAVHPTKCVCHTGWTGADCTTLDLAPAPPNGAIRREGWSTWGGKHTRICGSILTEVQKQSAVACA